MSNTETEQKEQIETIIEDISEDGVTLEATEPAASIPSPGLHAEMKETSCAIIFDIPQLEDEGAPEDANEKNGFSFHVLTPEIYNDAKELPFNIIMAHATSLFLAEEANVNIIMDYFQQKVDALEATDQPTEEA